MDERKKGKLKIKPLEIELPIKVECEVCGGVINKEKDDYYGDRLGYFHLDCYSRFKRWAVKVKANWKDEKILEQFKKEEGQQKLVRLHERYVERERRKWELLGVS